MKTKNLLLVLILTFSYSFSYANDDFYPSIKQSTLVPSAPQVNSKSYILIEANSKQVLAEKNSNERMAPASLTKIMTMYIVSNALKTKQISMDDDVYVSTKAWQTEGAKMFIKQGSKVKLKDIVNGIVVASGNDASIAIAEHIAGSEKAFAELMNITAKKLGMNDSNFVHATGLPDKNHYTTAKDLAILSSALINDFPEYYYLYKQKWFTYNKIKQPNRNRLLWRNEYVDGIKTGHTDEAGYCLIAAAKKDNMRLITVQMGAPSDSARTNNTQAILTWATRFYETTLQHRSLKKVAKVRIWKGKYPFSPLGIEKDLYVTVPKGQSSNIKMETKIEDINYAPTSMDKSYGTLIVKLNDEALKTFELHALAPNPEGNILQRMSDTVKIYWHKIVA